MRFATLAIAALLFPGLPGTATAQGASRRVVMLSPPNHGSEVVDKLGRLFLFRLINGPAGQELGTASFSAPRSLGEPSFDLGIITGNRSFNPLLSRLIPGRG